MATPEWQAEIGTGVGAWPQQKGTDGTCGHDTTGHSFVVTVNVNMGQYQNCLSE